MPSYHLQLSEDVRTLRTSDRQFKDIYRLVFEHGDRIFCETATMLRIHKTTNDEALRRIERLAAALAAEIGQTGGYVGLYGGNSERWILLFWAILRSGNRAYLINTRQPNAFTESVLQTLGAHTVVCCDEPPSLSATVIPFSSLDSSAAPALPTDAPFGNELALTTSGTTMQQKICVYRGENFAEQLCGTPALIRENPGLIERFEGQFKQLAFLPLYHIFGFSAMYLWYAFLGAALVFPPSLSPDALLRAVRRHEVTHIFAVPLLWHGVAKSVMKNVDKQDEKTQKKFRRAIDLSIRLQRISPKAGRRIAARLLSDVRAKLFGESVRFCITGGSGIAVAGGKGIDGQHAQRRGAVDNYVVEIVQNRLERLFHTVRELIILAKVVQLILCTRQRNVGGNQPQIVEFRLYQRIFRGNFTGQDILGGNLQLLFCYAETAGGVALGVEIHNENSVPKKTEGSRHVDGRSSLTHAALLVSKGNNFCHFFLLLGVNIQIHYSI